MADKRSVYEVVTDRILEIMEDGIVPWQRPWRTRAGAHMGGPANLVSKRFYRGSNVILLACAPYDTPYWVSYKQACQLGGHVKRGERGYPVVYWLSGQRAEAPADHMPEEEQPSSRSFLVPRYSTVFNVEQCEDLPESLLPPVRTTIGDFDPIPSCAAIVDGMPNPPRIVYGGDSAAYRAADDSVLLPEPAAFVSPERYYSTTFHELVHSTGHHTRLNRLEVASFGSPTYAREELVAELGAAILCGIAGVDPVKVESIGPIGEVTLAQSAAYIANWMAKLYGDPKAFLVAGARAQKAVDYIVPAAVQEGA